MANFEPDIPNFSSSIQQVPQASILQGFQQKATDQIRLNLQQQEADRNSIIQASQSFANATGAMVDAAKVRQKRDMINTLSQSLAAAQPLGQANLFIHSPNGGAIVQKVPTASYNPDQTNIYKSLATLNPEEFTKRYIDQQFPVKPMQLQTKSVMVNNVPTEAAYDTRTNTWYDQNNQPIKGTITPYSQNAQTELTDADRTRLKPLAQAVIEGRGTPQALVNARGAEKEKLALVASELDPSFDLSQAPQRQQMRKDYTSNGAAGKSLTAFNTAIAHSQIVDTALDKLDNENFPAWNKIANKAAIETGDPRLGSFKVARNLFADEMAKAAQGGTGIITESERDRQLQAFDAAASPQQMKAVVDTAIQLMASKSKVLQDNWNNTMKGVKPAVPFTTSQSSQVLKKRGYNPDTLEQEGQPTQPNGLNVDYNAIDAELKRRGLK